MRAIALLILSQAESRRARLEALLRLEYWLSERAQQGDRVATIERLELIIVLDKRFSGDCDGIAATLQD